MKIINTRHIVFVTAFLLAVFCIYGCSFFVKPLPQKLTLYKLSPGDYPEFYDDMFYDDLEQSILQSLTYLNRLPSDNVFSFGDDRYNTTHMIKSLEVFLSFIKTGPSKKELTRFIKTHYRVYRYVENRKPVPVLFTGYYEPFLEGSLNKSDIYRFPVYSLPSDLATLDLSLFSDKFQGEKIIGRYAEGPAFVPYHDRKAIEEDNALEKKATPIAWVNDQVDLFFLQIQGSGIIYLDNGQTITVHYHNTNGRPYRSIGAHLINENKIPKEEMSMQRIKAYLNDHPEEARNILYKNPSYIFFKIEENGPLGCLNVKLTPERSIATDRKIFPAAAMAFIETQKPLINGNEEIKSWVPFSRFVLNQDTGGAIRGPGRVDLFWGNGAYAEIAAGYMQNEGHIYFLILDPDADI